MSLNTCFALPQNQLGRGLITLSSAERTHRVVNLSSMKQFAVLLPAFPRGPHWDCCLVMWFLARPLKWLLSGQGESRCSESWPDSDSDVRRTVHSLVLNLSQILKNVIGNRCDPPNFEIRRLSWHFSVCNQKRNKDDPKNCLTKEKTVTLHTSSTSFSPAPGSAPCWLRESCLHCRTEARWTSSRTWSLARHLCRWNKHVVSRETKRWKFHAKWLTTKTLNVHPVQVHHRHQRRIPSPPWWTWQLASSTWDRLLRLVSSSLVDEILEHWVLRICQDLGSASLGCSRKPEKFDSYHSINVERSLEVKLPTIRTLGKAEESQRREEKKREDQRGENVRRKKMQVRKKVGKSRFTVFFQWLVALEGRKLGSLKRRVRSHVVRLEMEGKFPSQNVKNTTCSDHFWKLICWKSARRCGAKHASKSKC